MTVKLLVLFTFIGEALIHVSPQRLRVYKTISRASDSDRCHVLILLLTTEIVLFMFIDLNSVGLNLRC